MKINVVEMAYQIIDMHEEILRLRADVEYYKPYQQMYMDELNNGIKSSQEMIGTMLVAALDPNSIINKGLQKIAEEADTGEDG